MWRCCLRLIRSGTVSNLFSEHFRILPRWIACVFAALSWTVASAETGPGPIPLFLDDPESSRSVSQQTAVVAPDPGAVRSRACRIDWTVIDGPAEPGRAPNEVRFNLFADVDAVGLIGGRTVRPDGSAIVQGVIRTGAEIVPGGSWTLVRRNGAATGVVRVPGEGVFRIVQRAGSAAVITQLAPEFQGRCGVGVLIDENRRPARGRSGRASVRPQTLPPVLGPGTSAVFIVDVLVVYTGNARASAGGTDEIESAIMLAVAEANTIYQNSLANVRVRSVGLHEVDYVGTGNFSDDLNRLRAVDDGFMDDVHAIREERGADVTVLITQTGDTGFGGLAFTMMDFKTPSEMAAFRDHAFSVVRFSELVGTFTFVHEISHNLGCQHDRENARGPDGETQAGAFPFSFGHRFDFDGRTFRTVMAYPPGEQLPFISNPFIEILGVRLGVEEAEENSADNVETISRTASTVASFFDPATETLPPLTSFLAPVDEAVLVAGAPVNVLISATDLDGVAQVEIFNESSFIATAEPVAGGLGTFGFDWAGISPGNYQLTARATDTLGASSMALPVHFRVRPVNDHFADRIELPGPIPVDGLTVSGVNSAAGSEEGEPVHGANEGGVSVWYEWTPVKSGTIRFTATGGGFVPLPDVYQGESVSTLTRRSRRTSFDSPNFVGTSVFDVVGGQTYVLVVDGFSGTTGDFSFLLSFLEAPANDDFANATVLSGETLEVEACNTHATTEPNEPDHAGNPGGRSVWYRWVAPREGVAIVRTESANLFSLTDVYVGNSLANLSPTPGRIISFDQGSEGERLSSVTFDAAAGAEYRIAVAGSQGAEICFELEIGYEPAPANDHHANRIPIVGSRIEWTTNNNFATREPGEPVHADNPGGRSVWFSWIAPDSGAVSVTGAATAFFPLLDVYRGDSVANLQRIPRSVTFGDNRTTLLTFTAEAGVNYSLVVSGFQMRSGEITLELIAFMTPEISSPTFAGSFSFTIVGTEGTAFVVETSTNLERWTVSGTGVLGREPFLFQHDSPGGVPARFYRVRVSD